MRTNEIEKRMAHFKSAPLPPSNDSAKYSNVVRTRCALSFHNTRVPSVIVCLMCSWDVLRPNPAHRISLPWFCVQLDFYAFCTQKFATSVRRNPTPRNVFDATSVDQRLLPCPRNSVEVEIKFHLECKLRYPGAQPMLRQMHNEPIWKHRGYVLSLLAKFWRLKTALEFVMWCSNRWLKNRSDRTTEKRISAVSKNPSFHQYSYLCN